MEKKEYYTLRFASAMCFVGHGCFGIITKKIWLNYFAVFGINSVIAYKLMPVLGTVDILLGISLLVYPTRAVISWLIVWGLVTAVLRPLSGEPFMEMVERAGNYGAPMALLLLCRNMKNSWFSYLKPEEPLSAETVKKLTTCLKIVVFLLFIGHGWLNIIEKKGIISQYAALGFTNPQIVAHIIGITELIAALTLFIRPVGWLLITLLIWKMASELFYPHWELFEWVERGGSYGAILCFWFIVRQRSTSNYKQALAA